MEQTKTMTRKDLVAATGAMPYQITYLSDTGRLPIVRAARRRGDPVLYHPDAVEIINRALGLERTPAE